MLRREKEKQLIDLCITNSNFEEIEKTINELTGLKNSD